MQAIFLKELRDCRLVVAALIVVLFVAPLLPHDWDRFLIALNFLLLIPMVWCYLGARLLGVDGTDENLCHLLMLPISRLRIWCAKVGAGVLLGAAVALAALASSALIEPFRPGGAGLDWMVCALFSTIWLGAFSLGAVASLIWESSLIATFVAYMAGALLLIFQEILFERLHPDRVFPAPDKAALAYLFLLAVLALLVSLWGFCKADLLDRRSRIGSIARAGLLAALPCLGLWIAAWTISTRNGPSLRCEDVRVLR